MPAGIGPWERHRRCEAGENGERRINLWVSTRASLAIQRLAFRYCVTKRESVERLVVAEMNWMYIWRQAKGRYAVTDKKPGEKT